MINKKAILVISSTYPRFESDSIPGFVHELNKLMTDDFDVHVVVPHASGLLDSQIIDGVNVHRFKYAPSRLELLSYGSGILSNLKNNPFVWLLVPLFFASQFFTSLKIIKKYKCQLIHAHWIIPQGFSACLLSCVANIPALVTSHGADLWGFEKNYFIRLLKKWIFKKAFSVSVVSSPMRNYIVKNYIDRSIYVISMGVDLLKKFKSIEGFKKDIDIIFVGRIVEKKGLAVLIKALALMKCKNIKICVVGYGEEEAAIKKLSLDLGVLDKISFVGGKSQSEVIEYLNRSYLYVFPSVIAKNGDQEGLGLSAIEAMGCGCLVVASDLPVVHDFLEHGVSGYLFEPGDDNALSSILDFALENRLVQNEIIDKARVNALNKFDSSIVSKKYKEIYNNMLKGLK